MTLRLLVAYTAIAAVLAAHDAQGLLPRHRRQTVSNISGSPSSNQSGVVVSETSNPNTISGVLGSLANPPGGSATIIGGGRPQNPVGSGAGGVSGAGSVPGTVGTPGTSVVPGAVNIPWFCRPFRPNQQFRPQAFPPFLVPYPFPPMFSGQLSFPQLAQLGWLYNRGFGFKRSEGNSEHFPNALNETKGHLKDHIEAKINFFDDTKNQTSQITNTNNTISLKNETITPKILNKELSKNVKKLPINNLL